MRHPYPIREIARQAGLGTATVDRVLNNRGGVTESTIREVHQAIKDLDRQQTQVRIGGHTFMIDIVMQAPERFSAAVREALEAEMPALHPAVVRSRFHFRETCPPDEMTGILDKIAKRGTQGVILKAPDVPEIAAAVGRLAAAGIPVVTLVTDLPHSARLAYVGIDNRAAGATAAYLLEQWLGGRPGNVLTTISRGSFRGEEERDMGFRSEMRLAQPRRSLVEVTDSDGLDATQRDLVIEALKRDEDIVAVYSMGGATSPRWTPSKRWAGGAPSSSRTTSTRTTPVSCASVASLRCSTMTCARTYAALARPSCAPTRHCRTTARPCPRRSRWSRRSTCRPRDGGTFLG